MKNKLLILFFLLSINIDAQKLKIGLCITATNKYIRFVLPLIKTARYYFLKNHEVKYFVFTDHKLESKNDIVYIFQEHKPWPLSTMQRFEAYYKSKELLEKMDYVFACDADMLFMGKVSEEILSERVCVKHPFFWDDFKTGRTQYEQNPISTACIKKNEGQHYFAGGFYGGTSKEFLKLVKTNSENINKDLEKKFIAVWHDESHLNRYFINNPPTKALEPEYCYPQFFFTRIQKNFNFKKILIALDKNSFEMRN